MMHLTPASFDHIRAELQSTTGRQNQDWSHLSTNHRHSWRDWSRPVLECNVPLVWLWP